MSKNLARRDVVRGGIAAAAVLPLATSLTPAIAQAGEDAELLRLWEEWKAARARCEAAIAYFGEVEEKVGRDTGPHWQFAKADYKLARAIFISSRAGDASLKIVPIKFKTHDEKFVAINEARRVLGVEREQLEKAAKRKHKWASADRAVARAHMSG